MRPGVALDVWGWAFRESAGAHPDEELLRQVFDSAGLPVGRRTCGRAGWPAASLMPQMLVSCCHARAAAGKAPASGAAARTGQFWLLPRVLLLWDLNRWDPLGLHACLHFALALPCACVHEAGWRPGAGMLRTYRLIPAFAEALCARAGISACIFFALPRAGPLMQCALHALSGRVAPGTGICVWRGVPARPASCGWGVACSASCLCCLGQWICQVYGKTRCKKGWRCRHSLSRCAGLHQWGITLSASTRLSNRKTTSKQSDTERTLAKASALKLFVP
jgi:hypothetical protein